MAPRFVATQLSRPTGFGGWVIRTLMNRGNAALNLYAVDQLQLRRTDRVLEVGFGGGAVLPRLLADAGSVYGVDRASDVVDAASRQFSTAVRAGKAEFVVGSVEGLPLPDNAFDKVLTVHTVYFWESLEGGAGEIARVLKPGGRAVVGFVPKARMDRMNMPADIFTPRRPEDVSAAMTGADFHSVEVLRPKGDDGWMVATGIRR